jgi:hypothetical protein
MAIYPQVRGNNKRIWKRARDLEPLPDPLPSLLALFVTGTSVLMAQIVPVL